MADRIPVFLSVGEPHNDEQRAYLAALIAHLRRRGVAAETLGQSFWSVEKPLRPVQRKMREVHGAVVLAMERFRSLEGLYKEGSAAERRAADQRFATVWTHIEGAMAYQLDLPLLILKDDRLVPEGMFDPTIHEWVIIRVNIRKPEEMRSHPLKGYIDSWIEAVRERYYRNARR